MKKIVTAIVLMGAAFIWFFEGPKNIEPQATKRSSSTDDAAKKIRQVSTPIVQKKLKKIKKEEVHKTGELENLEVEAQTKAVSSSEKLVFNIETSFESNQYYQHFLRAYDDGDYEQVLKDGQNLLKLPQRYSEHFWYGDLLHSANIAMGKSSLAMGKVRQAEKYLLDSVSDKYIRSSKVGTFSPVLDSFGPDTTLAYELLKRGRVKTVIKYFEQTKKFWKETDYNNMSEVIRTLKQDGVHAELPDGFWKNENIFRP